VDEEPENHDSDEEFDNQSNITKTTNGHLKSRQKDSYSSYATMLLPNVIDDINKWNKAEKLNDFAGNLTS
jgi:hypothetical protein